MRKPVSIVVVLAVVMAMTSSVWAAGNQQMVDVRNQSQAARAYYPKQPAQPPRFVDKSN